MIGAALTAVCALAVPGQVNLSRPVSQCVACHTSATAAGASASHVAQWEASAHGRASVGCERCHGGNPATPYVAEAHAGVVNGRLPASTVHRRMIPKTCGACHRGAFDAFRNSRHFALLTGRDERAPSCATCHGAMAAQVPSPEALESRCAGCHEGGRAAEARAIVADANAVKAALKDSELALARERGAGRRQRLMTLHMRATALLLDAAEALHAFDLPRARTRVDAAQARIAEIQHTRGMQ